MYILFKRHPLDDIEKIIGIFNNKELALKNMNALFEQDGYCYSITYYPLNELNNGNTIAYITSE